MLDSLCADNTYKIVGVITQPDMPTGRKQELTPTEIKKLATEKGLKVFTPGPNKQKHVEIVEHLKPELIIVIGYGNILPKKLIDHPKYGCLNIHYSLLPQLRGAVPVQMAILHGLKKTGVTIQLMSEKLDEGPIIAQDEVAIADDETTPSLKEKLIPLGANLLMKVLPDWIDQKIQPREQDHTQATYCRQSDISKERAKIDWDNSEPMLIERMTRALLPWPVAWTVLPSGKRLKVYKAALVKAKNEGDPGTISISDNRLLFRTKDSDIALDAQEVQEEGKRRMSAAEFIKGYRA